MSSSDNHTSINDLLSDNDCVHTLKQILSFLLKSVSEDGSWRDINVERWNPMITTVAVDVLLQSGLKSDEIWSAEDSDHKSCSLRKSYEYLNSNIRDDGSFGTDFWDACRLGEVILKHDLKSFFPSFEKLNSYLIKRILENSIFGDTSEWEGPGFIAIALEYLDLNQMLEESEVFTKILIEKQNPEGSWVGITRNTGYPIISPVWHTSQAVSYLCRKDPQKYQANIDKAVMWLLSIQELNGTWAGIHYFQTYYTSYAIIALCDAQIYDLSRINVATKFLKTQMESPKQCLDPCGIVLCAYAFIKKLKLSSFDIHSIIENIMYSQNLERVEELQQEIQSLQDLCISLKKKISFYCSP